MIGRQPDMRVVAEANDGRQAVELWKKYRPDVTLLDLRMPEVDGLGAINELRQLDPAVRIIVLTTYDTDELIFRALKAGAKAYLLKDAPREELLECIRRVHGGETWVAADLAVRLAGRLSGESLSSREWKRTDEEGRQRIFDN
jgi:two-component system NarL family response regulator